METAGATGLWRVRIQIWVTFDTYKRDLKDKSDVDMPVYQVSNGQKYVSYLNNNFGEGEKTLHLLYRSNIHYDCLVEVQKPSSA